MDIQDAKIAKANARDKIISILQHLEAETGTKVVDIEYDLRPSMVVHGTVEYERKIRLVLEL